MPDNSFLRAVSLSICLEQRAEYMLEQIQSDPK